MADLEHGDHSHSEKEHHSSALKYVGIWVVLLVLTVATIVTARIDLGGRWNLVLALVIASVKAGLVVMYFMHLAEQKGANRIVFVVSVFFVVLLIGLTVGDVATRFPLTNPPTGQTSRAPPHHQQLDSDVTGRKPQPGSPSIER
ncbi:MAG TPA: cytochrome C oxidase subunit IV family protein [Myxococcaceae bacterium]|nr:cytochrome C oxidase subunit IV family protein [Myxococcaceae bacterium]